ncbi:hypothetical protein DCAR_0729438 [Daucus carota subsp. sativus]|uniref:Ubiquitin receptor RAD23 n=1 Tax=Daucus carota subsp. sativus TaxID=79200 RepID=A0A164U7M5_DAUCS|nr:PREDICTED: ubiquitin receptor RAD23b [Daucus carota subsp. sativus]WOH09977.1 hypothetical protein DCAR_0729438 [Daucus carota subsp. sativus]
MKLTVKTLKGSHFEIRAQPNDTVMAIKKNIEDLQGKDNYPCGQQLLIHNGKVLKDESTLAESKISEDGFLVVMLGKSKTMSSTGTPAAQSSSAPAPTPAPAVAPAPAAAPASAVIPNTTPVPEATLSPASAPSDTYGEAASNVVAGSNLEQTIQHIMDMGGGMWDTNMVSRALRAAYNNPERAVDYLYSGIPEMAEAAVPVSHFQGDQINAGYNAISDNGVAGAAPGAPNSLPLNMFPQETLSGVTGAGLGSLEFLRNNPQFQTLRSMVQRNPQILQPMLLELGKQNPQLLRQIQEHHEEFLQLINEPVEASEGDMFDQPEQDVPQEITVTAADQEAIERLEAMGFDRGLVIEAFLACDRNEELAVNYLLENAGDFED